MATIANQIKRISDSRDILRSKGVALKLTVPAGTYWDDATDTNITTTAAATLTTSDLIDKIAAAFNTIGIYHDQVIKVPLTIKRDGTTVVGDSTPLTPGFYSNAIITPFITVEDKEDLVLNIQTIANYSISTQTGTIKPSSGFNYIDSLTYTIVDGAIQEANAGYDNTGVTAKVSTSGWLDAGDTKKIKVDTSSMTTKVGSGTATTIASGGTITPNAGSDTTITISKGIYGSARTLTVKSVSSQTQGTATAPDILKDKVAWVNGAKVTGTMPNFGGTETTETYTASSSIGNYNGKLAIQPLLGYYNDYSTITTNITYNPTRTFNTTSISVGGTDTMSSQTYYETIPAGYYHTAITRKVTARSASGSVKIDYTNHKATFTLTQTGWIGSNVSADISAGPARFVLTESDLSANAVQLAPSRDADGTVTTYLTSVTVDNTVIFDLLSKI